MAVPLIALLLAFEGPPLEVPWKCGDVRACTQAHGGFSHTDSTYWAWDFDFSVGDEVLAASSGTVSYMEMSQPEGGCDPAFIADANYVIVDHGDGTSVGYTHLLAGSSPLEVGDAVVPGMLIARIGLSGYVCGDHLHFQVQQSCGSSFCDAVSAMFADYGDPQQGDSIESTNCPVCTLELAGGVTLIDELDPACFARATSYWWSTMEGEDDHHFYTIASDAARPASTGAWTFVVTAPGDYRVEVFIPQEDANAQGAVYQVHHAGASESFPIDQATAKGWQELGVFAFDGSAGERIQLDDNTGESVDLERHIGYDAVRFTFVPGGADSTGPGGASDEGGTGDPTTASASGGDETGGPASTTAATDDGTSVASALPDTFGEEDDAGCGCATSGSPARAWLLLFAVWWPAIRARACGRGPRPSGSADDRRAACVRDRRPPPRPRSR